MTGAEGEPLSFATPEPEPEQVGTPVSAPVVVSADCHQAPPVAAALWRLRRRTDRSAAAYNVALRLRLSTY